MITQLMQSLLEYLAEADLPLYLADCVPQNLTLPYMTAEAVAPFDASRRGRITLTLWCAGDIPNMVRLTLHDALMQYFPSRGLCLELPQGLAVLRPGEAQCVQDGPVLGVRTTLDVRYFPAE